MENAPSLDCGPSTLAVFALSASGALYHIVGSFQSPPMSVRDFLRDLRALMEVLGPLSDTVGTTTDVDLSALGFTLSRCGVACNEFKEEIEKQLPCPDDGSVSPQGWARLRCMGGNIDIVRHLVSGYKSAFEVTLAFTNLHRQTLVAAESLEHYKGLIKTAKSDLGVLLESLNDMIGSRIDLDACELQRLKEQRLSMDKCFEICTHSFDSIDLIEAKQEGNDHVFESYSTANPDEYGKTNFSTINNYSTGDAVVFMVSTDKRAIHGGNKALGWRSRYLTGHVNDESVQQVSKDFALMNTMHLAKKESTTRSNTSLTADNQVSCHPGPEYIKRYGTGSVLSKEAPTSPRI